LPVWALFLICIFAVGAPVLISALMRRSKNLPESSRETRPPQRPHPLQYTQDTIFNVFWRWSYTGNTIETPEAFCPVVNCRCRLDIILDYERDTSRLGFVVPVSASCPHCNFRQNFEWPEDELRRRVSVEIERLINTGQFQARLRAQSNGNS
jgi:hypothetical protein